MGLKIIAYTIMVGKTERNRPIRRHRHRWVDNIKIYLERDRLGWTRLIWLRIGTSVGLL
jgi:hypothetical protein